MALAFTSLCTPAEVAALLTDKPSVAQVTPGDDDFDQAAFDKLAGLCEAVTSEIEAHLDRQLVARAYVWTWLAWRPPGRSGFALGSIRAHAALAPEWPVVEAPEGVEIAGAEAMRLVTLSPPSEAAVIAGYRRTDQNLAAVQAEILTATTLPPVLPAALSRFATEYAAYKHKEQSLGIGQYDVEINPQGEGSARVRRKGVRKDWLEDNLFRIAAFRRIV